MAARSPCAGRLRPRSTGRPRGSRAAARRRRTRCRGGPGCRRSRAAPAARGRRTAGASILVAVEHRRRGRRMRGIERDDQRRAHRQLLQAVHPVIDRGGIPRRADDAHPARPAAALLRHEGRVGVQDRLVALEADRAQQAALGLVDVREQSQGLVRVAGEDDGVVLLRAAAGGRDGGAFAAPDADGRFVDDRAAQPRGQPGHVNEREPPTTLSQRCWPVNCSSWWLSKKLSSA